MVVSIAAGEAGKGVIAEESLPGKEPDPLDRMLSAELIERIAALLQEMPEKTRACLKLRLIDGYSPGEIARRLGITEQSVRTQVCRGKQKLREGLRDQIGKVDMLADDPDEGSEP